MLVTDQTPLCRFPLFRSGDFDEMRILVGRSFCPHRLPPVEARRRLDVLQNWVQDEATALNFLRYGDSVRALYD